jgi:hypothetical protein
MTNKNPAALRLADELLFAGRFAHESEDVAARRRINRNSQAAAELRRLHEVNQELLEALKLAETFVGFGKELDQIHEAIAKAEVTK